MRMALPELPSSTEPSAPPSADERESARLAELSARYQDYARTRSIAAVARLHGVSPAAIRKQCDREGWRELVLAADSKKRLTRQAVASKRQLDQLERVSEIVDEELDALDDPESTNDKLIRAGMAVQILERAQKSTASAHEALPEEPDPEPDLSVLSSAQFEILRALGELREGIALGRPFVAKPGSILELLEIATGLPREDAPAVVGYGAQTCRH